MEKYGVENRREMWEAELAVIRQKLANAAGSMEKVANIAQLQERERDLEAQLALSDE